MKSHRFRLPDYTQWIATTTKKEKMMKMRKKNQIKVSWWFTGGGFLSIWMTRDQVPPCHWLIERLDGHTPIGPAIRYANHFQSYWMTAWQRCFYVRLELIELNRWRYWWHCCRFVVTAPLMTSLTARQVTSSIIPILSSLPANSSVRRCRIFKFHPRFE